MSGAAPLWAPFGRPSTRPTCPKSPGDQPSAAEIADPEHHHHHFVDERSGSVQPFSDDELERAIAAVGRRLGVRLTGHDVVLRGIREDDPPHATR